MESSWRCLIAIHIVPCREEHIPSLMGHFALAYQFNPPMQELDYLRWQFCHTPWQGPEPFNLYLGLDNDNIQAWIGYVPLEFRFGGQVEPGCSMQNWHSLSKDGLGLSVLTRVTTRFPHVMVVGATPQALAIYRGLRFKRLPDLGRSILCCDAQAVEELFPNQRESLWRSAEALNSLNPAHSEVSAVERFDPEEEFPSREGSGVRRLGRYLNWRYVEIPRHNYQLIRSHNQFGVFRQENIKNTDHHIIRITEWTFTGTAELSALAWLRDRARASGVIAMDFLSSGQGIHQSPFNAGPIEEIPILFRPPMHSAGISVALRSPLIPPDEASLYITKGDGDVDRIKL